MTKQTLDLLREYESRNVAYVDPDGSWPIVWDKVVFRGRPEDGAFVAFYLADGRVVGATLDNRFPHDSISPLSCLIVIASVRWSVAAS